MKRVTAALVLCLAVAGCSGSDGDPGAGDRSKAEPVDAMVDVGGRRLHLTCDGSGSPTVILEAGLAGDHRTWDAVSPEVAEKTRVCAYDRANVEPSDTAATPRTARDMVKDLHALVSAGKLDPPYVLVGFSFGGLVSQLYASTYPEDVGGLVLVESNHPDEVEQFETELTKTQIAEDRKVVDANEEGVDVYASFEQVRAAPDLPDRPLVVVTAGRPAEWPPGWDADDFNRLRASQQKDLVGLVPDGTQVVAKQSGHEVPSTAPEVVVKAIETVLAKVD